MKVLLLQTELGVLRGGGENFSRNLLSAYAERGHLVSAAFFADRLGHYPLALPSSFTPLPLRDTASLDSLGRIVSLVGRYIASGPRMKPKWDRVQTGIDWRTFKWRQERFQRAVHRELASMWNDFDVVYVHSDVALASQVSKIRPTLLRMSGPVGQELKSELLALPAVCANGDALSRLRGFLGDHPTEIPIGLDDKLFSPQPTPIRADLGWTEQHFVVGYVGRFHHLKGVDLLASAFKRLSQVRPEARLLLIGEGEQEGTIRAMLADEITRNVVRIEPSVDHARLPFWYCAMDVFAMPSRYENFSNAILEAMACGVPFLSSNTGGNALLANTRGGWTFEASSDLSLSERLLEIVADRSEVKARGVTARRSVQGRYSWKASAECLERVISARLGVKP